MQNYVQMSLEVNLFFARTMKEHALFLKAGFTAKDEEWAKKAGWYVTQFEEVLKTVVELSNGVVSKEVLCSEEILTPFTAAAEKRTEKLTGADINTDITRAEKELTGSNGEQHYTRQMLNCVRRVNQKAVNLLNGLIGFKECVLKEVSACNLFTSNYPSMIEHLIEEAKLYRSYLIELERTGRICRQNMWNMELFWNQIMMEHALFIRGMLDSSECEKIQTADEFAREYERLIEEAQKKNNEMIGDYTDSSLKETKRYREFKLAATEGILDCEIASVILPLLADHVLREANHYLRILHEAELG